jgi:hypothetical protein
MAGTETEASTQRRETVLKQGLASQSWPFHSQTIQSNDPYRCEESHLSLTPFTREAWEHQPSWRSASASLGTPIGAWESSAHAEDHTAIRALGKASAHARPQAPVWALHSELRRAAAMTKGKRPFGRSRRSFGEQRSCRSASDRLGEPPLMPVRKRQFGGSSGRLGEPAPMLDRTGSLGAPVRAWESNAHVEGQAAVWAL